MRLCWRIKRMNLKFISIQMNTFLDYTDYIDEYYSEYEYIHQY